MSKLIESIDELISDYRKRGETVSSAAEQIMIGFNSLKEKGFIDHEEKVAECVKELLVISPYERYKALRNAFQNLLPKDLMGLVENEEYISFKREIATPLIESKTRVIDIAAGFGSLGAELKLNFQHISLACNEIHKEYFELMKTLYSICNISAELNNIDSIHNNKDLYQYDMVIFTVPFENRRLKVEDVGMEELKERKITSIGSEGALILKAIDYVRDGGIIIVTVPAGFLFGLTYKGVREIILEKTQVLLILECPKKIFENSTVNTSILVLRKKSKEDYIPEEFLAASFSDVILGTEEFNIQKEEFLKEWESFIKEERLCSLPELNIEN